MKKTTPIIAVLLVLGLSACDGTASRLATFAEKCAEAVQMGALEVAEDLCQRALGTAGEEKALEPEVRSERLYQLGQIKRQRAKFHEADKLLQQSLAIQETLSGPESPEVVRRLVERTLILAGTGQWEAGARILERVIPLAGQLSDKEKRSLGNISRRYVVQLSNRQQGEQAERLEAAAAQLSQQERQAEQPGKE